ncbi:slipin family protein [Cryptosporangium arvum]|uniref:slipin family protein n=1 Tax=Cryptosporangium arvum TaxID=80871 RepID=UPI0004ADB33E|nr:slipin family protein [Cryptosporangium arvum]
MAKVTVMEYERVVTYRDGVAGPVLGPGRHTYRRRRTQLFPVDLRPQLLTVPGQELLTADGLAVKVSATVRWRVADPAAFHAAATDALQMLYAAVQAALRDRVTVLALADALRDRAALGEGLTATVAAATEPLGVTVDAVDVKDLMLGAELRRAYAETALATERARADLERARGEAAALRALANTARLLEEHPALLHLRTLQVAGGPGTTIVLEPPGN